jgi:hypothetical protein
LSIHHVIAGLVPAISTPSGEAFPAWCLDDRDHRDKPGDDGVMF